MPKVANNLPVVQKSASWRYASHLHSWIFLCYPILSIIRFMLEFLAVPSGKTSQLIITKRQLCSLSKYLISRGGYSFGGLALWSFGRGDALRRAGFVGVSSARLPSSSCREVAPFWCSCVVRWPGWTRPVSTKVTWGGLTWIDLAWFAGTIRHRWFRSACLSDSHCLGREFGHYWYQSLCVTQRGTSRLHADFSLVSPCPVIVCWCSLRSEATSAIWRFWSRAK